MLERRKEGRLMYIVVKNTKKEEEERRLRVVKVEEAGGRGWQCRASLIRCGDRGGRHEKNCGECK